jgi:uncharacterized protein YecT (DUF1311 family)
LGRIGKEWSVRLLSLAGLVLAFGASGLLRPPTIDEHFAFGPCPAKPTSLHELQACSAKVLERLDRTINAEARTVFSRLSNPDAKRRFVRGEHAWLAARRAVCRSRADVYEGGSGALLVFVDCSVAQNRAHLRDLTAFARRLRRR